MKRLVIINPTSRVGRSPTCIESLKADFKRISGDFRFVVTSGARDIQEQTRRGLHDGFDQIIPVGGDGTLNWAVNGFFENNSPINPGACIAVTNEGTGSDYFRTVTGNRSLDWKVLVDLHELKNVDLGQVIYLDSASPPRLFINMLSVGASAISVQRKKSFPNWIPRDLGYPLSVLATVFSFRAPMAHLKIDERELDVELFAGFFFKGQYAGGGMNFGRGLNVRTGELGVVIGEKMGWKTLMRSMSHLYSGDFDAIKEITTCKGHVVQIESEEKIPVDMDGEDAGTTDIRIEVRKEAIKVCFPVQ